MTATTSIVNAALLAAVILLPVLGQTARQGRPVDEYYDEETYYDEKAADGAADFGADLTYAQYDQVTVKASPKSSSSSPSETIIPAKAAVKMPAKVPAKVPAKIPAKVPAKVPSKILLNAPTKVPDKVAAKVPADVPVKVPAKVRAKVPADVLVNAPATMPSTSSPSSSISKPSTRSVHAAMQQLLTTSGTTTSPPETRANRSEPPEVHVLDACRVLRSEEWLQLSLHTECVKLVRYRRRWRGQQLLLRRFRVASRTTELLWGRLLPLMPEEDRQDFQGCNMSYVSKTAKFCDRNLDNAREAARIVNDDEYPESPGRGWQMVCRLVKEYRYCMSELLAGCHSIGEEMSREVMVNVRAEGLNFCFSGGARCAATASWAVALAPVALWNRAAQRP
ncbi:uncharacterized protein LOC142573480 [Dermacentor variabilis]|uniref:uncharacterized protein LOC142573480 n=1 Tax=Dermacentor variabilis TaxID=34621 RepID=UPI003F5C9A8B